MVREASAAFRLDFMASSNDRPRARAAWKTRMRRSTSLVRTPGTATTPIPYNKIDVKAPLRLAHRTKRSIDYVVLINLLGGPRWTAYLKGGAMVRGDAHGRPIRPGRP